MKENEETSNWAYQLYRASHKLHGLAYLLAQDHSAGGEPNNLVDIREGIGAILSDLGFDIGSVAESIDLSSKPKRK